MLIKNDIFTLFIILFQQSAFLITVIIKYYNIIYINIYNKIENFIVLIKL